MARRLRNDMTVAELRLWARLSRGRLGGWKFRRQVPLGTFIVDFACPEARLIVEVDGGQHLDLHSDLERDQWLGAQGFRVLRFWNDQVLTRLDDVVDEILRALDGAVAGDPSPQSPPARGGGARLPQPSIPDPADALRIENAGSSEIDLLQMRRALALAVRAADEGEVPVGAVIVDAQGEVIGEGWNRPIATHDPSAHAEMLALRAAAAHVGNYRLAGTTLYVTLEPCVMCAGAIVHARVSRLVFGTPDPKAGGVRSVYDVIAVPRLNHVVAWQGGVLEAECGAILREFFHARRRRPPARDGA